MAADRHSDRFIEMVEARRALARQEAESIVAGYRPERVILFGSLARGDVSDVSDADLLIIKPSVQGRLLDRIGEVLQFCSGRIHVEPLVYSEEELDRMVADGNPLITQALTEGLVLYDRQQSVES